MHTNCNTFTKKFQNSSLFIIIRHKAKPIGVTLWKAAFSSIMLPNPLKSSNFYQISHLLSAIIAPKCDYADTICCPASKKRQSNPTEKQKSESPSPASNRK